MVVQSVYGPEVFPCSLKMKGVVHNHDMNKSDVQHLVKKLNIAPITFPINQKQITMKYFIPSQRKLHQP